MIYLLLGGVSACFGLSVGLGPATLLRPLLDAISPLPPQSVATLCTMAALGASLVYAFFVLNRPPALEPDELLLLALGAASGGVLGDLAGARFWAAISPARGVFLQNALLFTVVALAAVYFGALSRTLTPLSITRFASFPVAFFSGILASFLAFGGEPLTVPLYFLLFDARDGEAELAALTVSVFAMGGKLVTLLVRQGMALAQADALLWMLPGAMVGALLAVLGLWGRETRRGAQLLLRMSLFTTLLNIAAVFA